ncbi:MAG TPA: hypothetical protein VJ735_04540, partial [Actinomycetes bacterium]|nr:hypothetical protein [Actinomycetes bacterium]
DRGSFGSVSMQAMRWIDPVAGSGPPPAGAEPAGPGIIGRDAWAPGGWRGAAVVELPRSTERTPYVRAGDVVPLACWLALAVGAVVAAAARRGRLSRDGSGRRTGSTPRSTPARPRR